MAINFEPTPKQFLTWELLNDKTTTEVLYGGSLSCGKSRIACYYLILSCLQYPGVRYLLGRSELKKLKQTTLKTFFDITKEWNIEHLYNFNRQDNIITFTNGSEIILADLKQNPSDPDFIGLGSMELTGCVLDEGGEIPEAAYLVLKTRLRYKLKEFNLIPKMLICSNPAKNWMYNIFYKPYSENTLPVHRKFIPALPGDNKFNSQVYLDTLTPANLGLNYYNVLVLGNWEYASSDYDLFDYDSLMNCFYQSAQKTSLTRYITIDPASSGKDSTVISLWYGYDCTKIIKLEKNNTEQIVNKVKELMTMYQVRINNVIVDKVGVGTGVYDLLKGCVGFVANAKAFSNEPFQHLKAQLFFKFSQLVNQGNIGFASSEYRDEIIMQLEAHKRHNTDKDGRFEITPKPIVKQLIGCSPDFADALVMRAYYEYKSGSLPIWY